MKKKMVLLLSLALVLAVSIGGICACSQKRAGQAGPSGVNEVLEQGMAEADGKTDAEGNRQENTPSADPEASDRGESPKPGAAAEYTAENIDIDLTLLSSTMVYSEVYNMMADPEKYVGKTVKMQGLFSLYHDDGTGKNYFACIVQDATACCVQGIEFVLTEDYRYPEDYPNVEDEICVAGVFDIYEEEGYTYFTLRNAKLLS